jgi:putative flippase GtrA
MNRFLRQATGYVGASALAFGVDFLLLSLLVAVFGVPYLLAAALSFLAGTVVVYWLSIRHVFDYRRLDDWRREFAIFAALGLVGLVVNLAVIYSLVERLGLHYLVAKVGAAGCTFIVNFLLRRWLLFLPRGHRQNENINDAGIGP